MNAIYNEIEPFACDWLERLAEREHIAAGRVERRSITDLTADDVRGPGQRHFFAGIGVWSYALRLAGVPDDASIWTGSCPCQPFSSAGSRRGTSDARHLWPAWFALIEQCRPAIIFGEQVASRDGLAWLDLVFADLERCGYTVGAADLCAAGVGAPHIRQRLFFVAYASSERCAAVRIHTERRQPGLDIVDADRRRAAGELANASGDERGSGRGRTPMEGRAESRRSAQQSTGLRNGNEAVALGDTASRERRPQHERARSYGGSNACAAGSASRLEDANIADAEHGDESRSGRQLQPARDALTGFWAGADWIECADGVSRPVEPGTFPLAHGAAARVGRLRGYGNAIVAEVAATFIEAALEAGGLR